jgi:hypothetical protein
VLKEKESHDAYDPTLPSTRIVHEHQPALAEPVALPQQAAMQRLRRVFPRLPEIDENGLRFIRAAPSAPPAASTTTAGTMRGASHTRPGYAGRHYY